MSSAGTLSELMDLRTLILTAAYALPRILGAFLMLPFLSRQVLPGMLQTAVAFGLAMVVLPTVVPIVPRGVVEMTPLIGTILKETLIGLTIGLIGALIFWGVEAIGFFIDNQRGASMASSMNPLSQSDSSPVGVLLYQAFLVYFFVSGAFLAFLTVLYDSYLIWPIGSFEPQLRLEDTALYLGQLDRLMYFTVLLSAPVIIVMFLAEMGLALVSRFAPQLNVFFLAMPIKSAVGLLLLIVYMSFLFGYLDDYAVDLPKRFGELQRFIP